MRIPRVGDVYYSKYGKDYIRITRMSMSEQTCYYSSFDID